MKEEQLYILLRSVYIQSINYKLSGNTLHDTHENWFAHKACWKEFKERNGLGQYEDNEDWLTSSYLTEPVIEI